MIVQELFRLGLLGAIFHMPTVDSGFQKTPSNTVAVVGQPMKMSCWTHPDDTTQWRFSPYGQRSEWVVFNGVAVSPKLSSRFTVDMSTGIGHRDLICNNVTLADAGIYKCVTLSREAMGVSLLVSAVADLMVFESDLQCDTNVSVTDGNIKEFDYVALRCAVNFSGRWTPSMQWSMEERVFDKTSIVTNGNISDVVQHLSSIIILQVNADYNGVVITCKIEFSETPVTVLYDNVTNVPNNSFQWNIALNVHFGARNATIILRREKNERVDVLLYCTADGNPGPSYTWRFFRTKETIAYGPHLAFKKTSIDVDRYVTIECIAENHVAGEIKLSSATVDVLVTEQTRSSGTSSADPPASSVSLTSTSMSATASGSVWSPLSDIGVSKFWFGLSLLGAACGGAVLALVALRILKCIRKCRTQTNFANENTIKSSADYESVRETEIGTSVISPSTATKLLMAE